MTAYTCTVWLADAYCGSVLKLALDSSTSRKMLRWVSKQYCAGPNPLQRPPGMAFGKLHCRVFSG